MDICDITLRFDDPWYAALSAKAPGRRVSYSMMIDFRLDITRQWKIQSMSFNVPDHVYATFMPVAVDLEDAESVMIDAQVEMAKRDLIWQSSPNTTLIGPSVEWTSGSITSLNDSSRLEFVDGTTPLGFWTNVRHLVCDWDLGDAEVPTRE